MTKIVAGNFAHFPQKILRPHQNLFHWKTRFVDVFVGNNSLFHFWTPPPSWVLCQSLCLVPSLDYAVQLNTGSSGTAPWKKQASIDRPFTKPTGQISRYSRRILHGQLEFSFLWGKRRQAVLVHCCHEQCCFTSVPLVTTEMMNIYCTLTSFFWQNVQQPASQIC